MDDFRDNHLIHLRYCELHTEHGASTKSPKSLAITASATPVEAAASIVLSSMKSIFLLGGCRSAASKPVWGFRKTSFTCLAAGTEVMTISCVTGNYSMIIQDQNVSLYKRVTNSKFRNFLWRSSYNYRPMATEIFHELLQCSVIDVVDHNGRVIGDFLSYVLGHSVAHLTQACHILSSSAEALMIRLAMEVDRTYEAIGRSFAIHNCDVLKDPWKIRELVIMSCRNYLAYMYFYKYLFEPCIALCQHFYYESRDLDSELWFPLGYSAQVGVI